MGAVEETGKAIGGALDAMRIVPAVIALLSMNIIILVFAGYIAKTTRNDRPTGHGHPRLSTE
jgi:hypothetical protein